MREAYSPYTSLARACKVLEFFFCTQIFIASLSVLAKNGKPSKRPSPGGIFVLLSNKKEQNSSYKTRTNL